MVAAAHPLAVEAGIAMLAKGGSAIDAAIATQMVLTLVEPQSSGIGGGAFVVTFDARTRDVATYDGRETAPAGATSDLFLDAAGKPLPFADGADRRARGRHARRAAGAGARASRAGPIALGRAVRAGDPAGGGGLRAVAAPSRRARRGAPGAARRPVGRRVLLPGGRQPQAGGHALAQSRTRRDAEGRRGRWRGRLLPRSDRAGHRRRGARRSDESGHARGVRSRVVPGGEARAAVRPLPRQDDLRHGHAVVRHGDDADDAGAGRALRSACDGRRERGRGPR